MARRIDMTVRLGPRIQPEVEGARTPTDGDRAALAELLLDAYAGTVDSEEETFDQAVAEIDRTFGGEYGPFMAEHSTVVARGETLVSATLITGWQGRPFVAYSMTRPQFQRQGMARDSLLRAMASLNQSGHDKLSLVVTLANTHAHRLYERLGFVPGR